VSPLRRTACAGTQADDSKSIFDEVEEALLQPVRARLRKRRRPVASGRHVGAEEQQENAVKLRSIARRALGIALAVLGSGWLYLTCLLVLLAWFVRPEYLVRRARDNARVCLAQTRAPRGPTLPSCAMIVREFDLPTDYRYTRHDATYRAEELLARVAMDRYLDGAVGDPSPERLYDGSLHVKRLQGVLETGSRRISLEELGPTVPSPHLGKMASALGDRATLLERQDDFKLWYLKRDVVEAALLEADFDAVRDAALHYQDVNPTEADLRTTLGAALCITSPDEGFELLATIPAQRAEKRYANIQRNYGEMFAVLEACAWKVGASEPQLPKDGSAGEADAAEVRMLAKLRKSAPGPDRRRRVSAASELLHGDSAGQKLDPKARYARGMLLSAVLALSEETYDPAALVKLAAIPADGGEGPIGPRELSLSTILDVPPGLHPIVQVGWIEAAAKKYEDAIDSDSKGANKSALVATAGGLHMLAALELANAGDPVGAVTHATEGARLQNLPPRTAALSIASAAYVAGDGGKALSLIAPRPPADPKDAPDLELGLLTLETTLRARDGQPQARELGAKLGGLAAGAKNAELALAARWLAVALARDSVPREGANLTWTGQADTLGRYRERGERAVAALLATWANALDAGSAERRAFRFALLDRRGDLPATGLGQLYAAQLLLDETTEGPGAEIWLDALTAIDARRLRLRSYAWLRMEAARFRGDGFHEHLWGERLAVLRAVASEEADLEATRFLRF
jgi:hypothetical protein